MKYHRCSPGAVINVDTHPHLAGVQKVWQTDRYTIMEDCPVVKDVGPVRHLRIVRHDGGRIDSFADLQRIKDDLWGKKIVAIQVFPASEDLIDVSNTLHLWASMKFNAPNLKELYEYKE